MLEVSNLSKSFGGVPVLRGISMRVDKGDVTAVIGPSGGGKTTLLRCLNFLERADDGQMVFGENSYDLRNISKRDIAAVRMRTGFVFQSFNLFSNKTAIQNVTEGLVIARKMPREEANDIAMKALERVGLKDRASYYPGQLSGGQQQRVAIARALATDPEIIYFDEPTSALDPELIGEVLAVMRDLAGSGMTMLVVTHEMRFARDVSSQVIFMEDGQIIESGPSAAFFAAPREARTQTFLRNLSAEE
ncbi:MAG: amino acid ABC transporter ATP-binding protein [Clostridia bacterium]|nr:amino acid ABC transporter ATP-binding protein [Clostridia bacterium]MBR5383964.1 amino acid ABC transporter ATP-binding protein [Clostridia bacterium]